MDRLICGDVGYGKTEVALRAAFKAANDGKQVLMLVPTTILAQQHFGTFTERLRDYPFTIEHVSRFRPAADRAGVRQGLGVPADAPVLLTVRNLEARMGLDLLLRAVALLRSRVPGLRLLVEVRVFNEAHVDGLRPIASQPRKDICGN